MPEQDDVAVAFHVLQQGVVTRDQLLDALYAVIEDRTTGLPVRALGTILVQKGYLQQTRLRQIIATSAAQSAIPEEATRGDSIKLGQLLAMAGVVTYGQVMEALLQQEAGRGTGQPRRRLGEYLVSMGYTTPQAIQRALSYQRKVVYACRKCEARFNIVNAHPDRLYQCVKCEGPLAPEADSVRVEESAIVEAFQAEAVSTAEPRPAEVAAAPLDRLLGDRTLAHYLRESERLPQATIDAAQHWQIEIAQFGLHAPLKDVLRRMRALSPEVIARLPAPASPPAPTLPGCRLNGMLACGSRTAVYSALSEFRPGPIGVKLLHAEAAGDDAGPARFRHDAALLHRFDHPNLLRAYEHGTAPGAEGRTLHFATVEYVRASALDHLITVKGRLPPTRALLIALDIANALKHLEKEGFVHGDLQAEHVLVDERLRAKVADLGAARPTAARDAHDPQTPEDVLAFGKLFRAMLTGSLQERPGADLGSASVSPSVLGVLRATLHSDPTRRFQRFSDLAAVLQTTTQG